MGRASGSGAHFNRGKGITPNDLVARWKSMGTQKVVEFYGHRDKDGQYNIFSNFFEQTPLVFEVPEYMCESCPRLTKEDRQVSCAFSEKAIMLCKAAIMGDAKAYRDTAASTNPRVAKQCGRRWCVPLRLKSYIRSSPRLLDCERHSWAL